MPETLTASQFSRLLEEKRPYEFFAYNSGEQSEAQTIHAPEVRATFRSVETCVNGTISFIFHEKPREIPEEASEASPFLRDVSLTDRGASLTLRDVRTVVVGDPLIADVRSIHFISNPDTGGTVRATVFRACERTGRDSEDNRKEVSE